MNRAFRNVLALVILVAAALAAAGYWQIFAAKSSPGVKTTIVPQGASFREIASQLASAGIVRSAPAFLLYGKMRHADRDVHAGEFQFPGNESMADVLQRLQSGGAQIAKWLTIPEGFTSKQLAVRLEENGFGAAAAYERAFQHDTIVIDGQRTKNLEGYLFPSTYLIPLNASPKTVEDILTGQFRKVLPRDAAKQAKALGLTVPQVITVASLIEGEAKADDERPLMAGVYYNRLRLKMPLQVDATLEYAFPEHKSVITNADLQVDSPYNSYKYAGLPPTPIDNPGAPSIRAAFHPQPSQFLYYVYRGNGHHVFAKTLSEHQANVAKYLK
jgi:UPF0755 protein